MSINVARNTDREIGRPMVPSPSHFPLRGSTERHRKRSECGGWYFSNGAGKKDAEESEIYAAAERTLGWNGLTRAEPRLTGRDRFCDVFVNKVSTRCINNSLQVCEINFTGSLVYFFCKIFW